MATVHDLEALAATHGIAITRHIGGEKGRWYGDTAARISIREGLHPVHLRCTLAHELGHAILHHEPDATGWLHSRQEREADEWAALFLISTVEYASAEMLCGAHPGAIAKELGVTVKLLEAWCATRLRKASA